MDAAMMLMLMRMTINTRTRMMVEVLVMMEMVGLPIFNNKHAMLIFQVDTSRVVLTRLSMSVMMMMMMAMSHQS